MALSRLTLNDFRNHAALEIRPQAQFLALHGTNGAGKTNILEAVSLLVPGRGLRRAAMSDMVRSQGNGGFTIVGEVGGNVIGTGVSAEQPERRKVRVNESNAAINSLAEWLSVIWLTPAMDRLFADGAAARRRFLDRLVLAINPGHARHSSRYEKAMQQRNRLLAGGVAADPLWLDALEAQMAESGNFIQAARICVVEALSAQLLTTMAGPFATPQIRLIDIALISKCYTAAQGKSLSNVPQGSRRHCCCRSFLPMRRWYRRNATLRRSYCWMRSRRISIRQGAPRCLAYWPIQALKSG